MNRETIFSPDRKYRYTLWREWQSQELDLAMMINQMSPQAAEKGYVNFICLNPSTADESNNDPTITRCIDYSKRWGYSGFCMTNIFAFRATDPEVMKAEPKPIGLWNDGYILDIARASSLVVCGWGIDGGHMARGQAVKELLLRDEVKMHALKVNQDGSPNHPLYLKKTLIPRIYE